MNRLISLVALTLIAFAVSCGGKKADEESSIPNAVMADENESGDSDSGKAMGLQTVHFPYDSNKLTEEGKRILKANASILKDKSSARIQIEGHCDERGSIQYNIALGERRANATKAYLVDLGVGGDRIEVISFGEERPAAQGATEEAFAKNRRANFVVISR